MIKKNLFLISILFFFVSSCGGGAPNSPVPLPTISFSSTSASASLDSKITLTWSSVNASSCAASGDWIGQKSSIGSEEVILAIIGNNTFNLTCNGKGGSSNQSIIIEGYRLLNGVVVDGYISGAEVFIDQNDNLVLDFNESQAISDNEGKFSIKFAEGNLISIGGIDLDSMIPLENFSMTRPVSSDSNLKIISPITSIASFLSSPNDIYEMLDIDTSINIFTFDPVANKGDDGINNYLYEKGIQATVLAYSLQSISNKLNSSSEITIDFFKSMSEELKKEFSKTSRKVEIQSSRYVSNVLNNIVEKKELNLDENLLSNISKVISSTMKVLDVKDTENNTNAVVTFSISTLQEDITDIINESANPELIKKYDEGILGYIASDQGVNASDIAPSIGLKCNIEQISNNDAQKCMITEKELKRKFWLYSPSTYSATSEALPLIFSLHGGGGNGLTRMNYDGFLDLAELNNFIVVYPQGLVYPEKNSTGWNTGPGQDINNDLLFFESMIDLLSRDFNINLDKVYVTGFSMGGFMSYDIACSPLSQKIAAVAPVSGKMFLDTFESCTPKHSMPVLHIHGANDYIVNLAGDLFSKSVEDTIDYWKVFNNCTSFNSYTLEDINGDGFGGNINEYSNCSNNASVKFLLLNNIGHEWPRIGSSYSVIGGPGGGVASKDESKDESKDSSKNYDVDAPSYIWDFFKLYNLNGTI